MRESHDFTIRHVRLLVAASLTGFAGLVACSSDGTSPNLAGGESSAGGSATGGADATAGAGGAVEAGGGGSAGAMAGGGADGGGGGGGGGEVPDETGTRQAAYYVSPSGSDDNPGTASAPFKTVAKARDVVRTVNAGMTGDIYVYLRAGTYSLTDAIAFAPSDSGTNGHRIYYQAYPGETPVLNGATKVTGWTPDTGNIYKAKLDRTTKLRNLYVNDARALMTSKRVTSRGGVGTYGVTAGQHSWAWATGSGSDGAKYDLNAVPAIASNKDDLEIVNGTTWNENIVCVRDVTTTPDNFRALLFQQPYGTIAQTPGWNSGFSVSGSHTIYNAREFLDSPGQFYFDKTTGTLYYYPRQSEDMAQADVQAPIAEKLIDIVGASSANRVKNLTFQGITFANTDYNLYSVDGSRGKATVQGATIYVAYGDGNWHNSKYEIIDTLPGMITVNNADSINFIGNVVKHSGNEGISFINDVVNSSIVGNYITDIAGSGITVGHPQHLYVGDTGPHQKFGSGVEGICKNDTISNNLLYDVSSLPGFGGHSGITAFFVDGLKITYNHIQKTAYNGINLGWGWRNFPDSTTCKDNAINNNRFIDTLSRLHDSGAVYTLGQMPGTTINENYVKGIPPATSGPTYGLHNDEGSAYITQNDNVLDIDPGVKYTINCEDFGAKHHLTILRTYATVNKMGINPPDSRIDPPVAVPDNMWPAAQYEICLSSGIQEEHRGIIPSRLLAVQDYVFPASASVASGTKTIKIRSTGAAANAVWLAPAGTGTFTEGATMTKAAGDATSIAVPASAGTYKLHVVDAQGEKLGESAAQLRVR
ncbi:right-handed parallel beta-helix repeat-containing protein [Sorangium sp. So ce693]|uniref:right-handed parallel beta-helix repeat-containing protein n=1 Tax=Sorangium sp. So ce693 TaxID=3133318 RepID=UPI003F642C1B